MKYKKELLEQLKSWPLKGPNGQITDANTLVLMCIKDVHDEYKHVNEGEICLGARHYDEEYFEFVCTRQEYLDLKKGQGKQPVDKGDKYKVIIRNRRTGETITVDTYDVLEAFNITCSALAHAIKKLLMPGKRGSKSYDKDCDEAINSVEQSKLLQKFRAFNKPAE